MNGPQKLVKCDPGFIARRLVKLAEKHGAPNSFGMQDVSLYWDPLTVANVGRLRMDEVNHVLHSYGLRCTYQKATKRRINGEACFRVEPLEEEGKTT